MAGSIEYAPPLYIWLEDIIIIFFFFGGGVVF